MLCDVPFNVCVSVVLMCGVVCKCVPSGLYLVYFQEIKSDLESSSMSSSPAPTYTCDYPECNAVSFMSYSINFLLITSKNV